MVHRGKRHVAHAMNVTWTHLSCYFSVLKTHTIQRKCQSPLKRAARFANCIVELLGAISKLWDRKKMSCAAEIELNFDESFADASSQVMHASV